MMMQIIKVPKYKMHWFSYIHTEISDLISINRSELISRCLYYAEPEEKTQDPLWKIIGFLVQSKENAN